MSTAAAEPVLTAVRRVPWRTPATSPKARASVRSPADSGVADRRAMRLAAYRSLGSARHQAAALTTGLPTIRRLGAFGTGLPPTWQWRFVTGRCTRFHRAHEQTEPEGRGLRTSGWLIPSSDRPRL
jgi:hypothetical protein